MFDVISYAMGTQPRLIFIQMLQRAIGHYTHVPESFTGHVLFRRMDYVTQ